MRISKPIVLALVALALVAADVPGSGDPWAQVVAPEIQTRAYGYRALAETLDKQAGDYLQRCIQMIEADPPPAREPMSPKACAVELLGVLRKPDAVPVLVKHIGYSPPEIVSENTALSGKPVVRALIAIGLPSVAHILSPAVLRQADADALGRFALVVRHVFPDAQTARAFVAAYDPGYDAAAKAKHAQLQELLAKLP